MPLSIAAAPPPLRLANRQRRKRSPISLTPLIDVVFILLIFFMLASSFLDWRTIALDVPEKGAGSPAMTGALLVELRADGLRLSGESLTPAALVARVQIRLAAKPDQRVLVKPSPGVTLQEVVALLDRLTAAGVRDLSLIRDPEK
jgi:biopolymer transport protein ExbD